MNVAALLQDSPSDKQIRRQPTTTTTTTGTGTGSGTPTTTTTLPLYPTPVPTSSSSNATSPHIYHHHLASPFTHSLPHPTTAPTSRSQQQQQQQQQPHHHHHILQPQPQPPQPPPPPPPPPPTLSSPIISPLRPHDSTSSATWGPAQKGSGSLLDRGGRDRGSERQLGGSHSLISLDWQPDHDMGLIRGDNERSREGHTRKPTGPIGQSIFLNFKYRRFPVY
jgi:hypothetical protein